MQEFFLAAVLLAQNAPFREIGRTSTSAMCASLRDEISRVVAGAARNDDAIAAGQTVLNAMSTKASNASLGDISPDLELDRQRLSRVAGVLSHNLAIMQNTIRKLAANEKAASPDAASSIELESHLASVVTSQQNVLNLVSGSVLTDELGQMQTDYPKDMGPAALDGDGHPDPSGETNASSYLSVAGLPRGANGTPVSGFTALQGTGTNPRWSVSSSSIGHTAYDRLIHQISAQQSAIKVSEEAEVIQISSAIHICRNVTHEIPSP